MKHRNAHRTLGRKPAHRLAMLKTMVTQLITHERIETTLTRAKELRKLADKVVTYGKKGDNNALRQAKKYIKTDFALHRVFNILNERYKYRNGGYTRILQTRNRTNDRAPMAYIEYIDREGELRPPRPPTGGPSLLPAAAEALVKNSDK